MTTLQNDRVRVVVGIIYIFFFAYLLFFASFREDTLTTVNLVPFKSTVELIRPIFTSTYWPGADYFLYVFLILFGNVFLLLPIPVLFSLDWKGLKKWLLILGVPFTIELLQYLFKVGSADIDDIFFNALGCYVGFWFRARKI